MSRFKNAIKYAIPLPVLAFAAGAAYAPAPHYAGPASNDTHTTDAPEVAAVTDHLTAPKTSWETAPQADSGFTYTVKPGDTLSSIAKSLLGHAHYWPAVWKANENKIHNPNVLTIGQQLDVPGTPAKVSTKLAAEAYAAIPQPAPAPLCVRRW
jgi:nucleoid-associated protein YgaU